MQLNPTERRVCEGCGQPIPPKSMMAKVEDGKLLCLACQIKAAQDRGIRH